ncbi:L-threonylcarbamoyladenylate synthase [Caldalkalibacillus salinus]|uniref:L-threonylcarbamoyladenylate synthase n=1 Tax=Caldalkalibacillus salinus TaxID=2803787 RepID=UPI0019221729|nr:L-threonylcarbamoyladenylate synthase [Caldalkalibacillus salinus]
MKHQKQTKHWVIHGTGDNCVDKLIRHPHIHEAAKYIRQGEVVSFPTETVYGLGANALSDEATKGIFEAKGRPSDNPLIVHISSVDQLSRVVDNVDDRARTLMNAFWPGPLTIVLEKSEQVCSLVTADLSTVGVRMPDHPVARALIEVAGLPLAAPSANRSGKPSPTSAGHVLHDLDGRIAGVIDGGETGVGVESTVLDITQDIPVILRPGGVTQRELTEVIGQVNVDPALSMSTTEHVSHDFKPISPGMKYKHYAPEGELWVVDNRNGTSKMRAYIKQNITEFKREGSRVGVLTTDDGEQDYTEADLVISLGSREDLHTVARRIYDGLRQMDAAHVDLIFCEGFSTDGIGAAIMNRLLKAAGGRVHDVR